MTLHREMEIRHKILRRRQAVTRLVRDLPMLYYAPLWNGGYILRLAQMTYIYVKADGQSYLIGRAKNFKTDKNRRDGQNFLIMAQDAVINFVCDNSIEGLVWVDTYAERKTLKTEYYIQMSPWEYNPHDENIEQNVEKMIDFYLSSRSASQKRQVIGYAPGSRN